MQVRATRRLPRVFSAQEVQALLNACMRQRDRFLVSLLYESGMRIGQALGLRHADIRSYDGEIDIVPRSKQQWRTCKIPVSLTVHVSKEADGTVCRLSGPRKPRSLSRLCFRELVERARRSTDDYSTVIDLFRKLSARAGLHATPHMFRHTHATDLYCEPDGTQHMSNAVLGTHRSRPP
jgi:integrase/recombinase XerD